MVNPRYISIFVLPNTKYSPMTNLEIDALVAKAVGLVKSRIDEQIKNGRNSCCIHPRTGRYMYDTVYFSVCREEIFDGIAKSDAKGFFRKFKDALKEMGCDVKTDEVYTAQVYWMPAYEQVTEITYLAEPCKEFKDLAKYVAKHAGVTLDPKELYSVDMFGKRGRLDSETGSRFYFCHDATRCGSMLKYLRENRKGKDTLYIRPHMEEYCEDRDISIRLETECYGYKKCIIDVKVSTPGGKTKAVAQFCEW